MSCCCLFRLVFILSLFALLLLLFYCVLMDLGLIKPIFVGPILAHSRPIWRHDQRVFLGPVHVQPAKAQKCMALFLSLPAASKCSSCVAHCTNQVWKRHPFLSTSSSAILAHGYSLICISSTPTRQLPFILPMQEADNTFVLQLSPPARDSPVRYLFRLSFHANVSAQPANHRSLL